MNELRSDEDKANIGPGTGKGLGLICCLCGKPIVGYGHNPEPLGKERCCDRCNYELVIPARMGLAPGAHGTLEDWQARFKEGRS